MTYTMTTTSIPLHYHKIKYLDVSKWREEWVTSTTSSSPSGEPYNPFDIKEIQNYVPLYSLFFDLSPTNYNHITLNHRYMIRSLTEVEDLKTHEIKERPIFIKFSPLLDPLRFMTGKYPFPLKDTTIELPSFNPPPSSSSSSSVSRKLNDTNNASYIDAFFCFLSSRVLEEYKFVHSVDYYGTCIGIQRQYRMNIIDDYEFLQNSTFFNDYKRRFFHIETDIETYSPSGSRSNKRPLVFGEVEDTFVLDIDTMDTDMDTIIDVNTNVIDEPEKEKELVYEYQTKEEDDDYDEEDNDSIVSSSSSSSSSTLVVGENGKYDYKEEYNGNSNNENENSSSSSSSFETASSSSNEEDDDDEEEDETIYSYMYNFPVQMICMEKCDGTLDELFVKNEVNEITGSSILFQIVMILLMYQRLFSFTHNDLHTNNIMFVHTDIPFLYYYYQKRLYKVPTFGKIFKIIDFGRAIYRFQNRIFCSDSFAENGDAATQYNTEPYMNPKKPRIDPNFSFDLCRLGTSIYDFIIDIDDEKRRKLDGLQETILRWCKDDKGKNVLYKKNGEEKYPNFKLYKMIARTVHHHTPENQLEYPFFKQFRIKKEAGKKEMENVMIIP